MLNCSQISNVLYLSVKIAAKPKNVKRTSQKKSEFFSKGKVGIMENELENTLRGPSLETLEKLEDFLQTRIMGQEKS